MKMFHILNAYSTMMELGANKDLSLGTVVRIRGLLKEFDTIFKAYEEKRSEAQAAHEGTVTEDGKGIDFPSTEDRKAFEQKVRDLMSEDVDLNAKLLSLETLKDVRGFDVSQITMLVPFIEELKDELENLTDVPAE